MKGLNFRNKLGFGYMIQKICIDITRFMQYGQKSQIDKNEIY